MVVFDIALQREHREVQQPDGPAQQVKIGAVAVEAWHNAEQQLEIEIEEEALFLA